jgi:hypothetical protein
MPNNKPTQADRLISHTLVGLAVAFIASQIISGAPGAIIGFVAGVIAHDELDAPVAQVIADLA